MKLLRWGGAALLTVASVMVALDQDTVPHTIRAIAQGVLMVAGTLGVPAVRKVTIAAVKRDVPAAAPAIERVISGASDG